MLYEYLCPECNRTTNSTSRDSIHCALCGSPARRIWSVYQKRSVPAHFNHAVGRHVSNEREFRDALKERSEEHWKRTGFEANFQPVDPTDQHALGVTDEGLEETARRGRD